MASACTSHHCRNVSIQPPSPRVAWVAALQGSKTQTARSEVAARTRRFVGGLATSAKGSGEGGGTCCLGPQERQGLCRQRPVDQANRRTQRPRRGASATQSALRPTPVRRRVKRSDLGLYRSAASWRLRRKRTRCQGATVTSVDWRPSPCNRTSPHQRRRSQVGRGGTSSAGGLDASCAQSGAPVVSPERHQSSHRLGPSSVRHVDPPG